MEKSIKLFALTLVLAIAAVCTCVFAAACGDKDNGTDYTVTVVYPDGKAVNGTTDGTAGTNDKSVTVQFCEVDANKTELKCLNTIILGADGKITKSDLPDLADGHSWHVKLNGIPAGYTYEDVYMTKPATITITLKAA